MKKTIIAALFFISIFLSFFLNMKRISVPYFGGIYKDISIDLTLKNDMAPEVLFNTSKINKILKIDKGHYLISPVYNFKINKITLNNPENVEKIILYNGNEMSFFQPQNEIITDNSRDIISYFTVFFLSLFYNPYFYILSYIFLVFYLSRYGFNFSTKIMPAVIFLLAFILRISSLNGIPFWDDEVYSIVVTDKFSPVVSLFNDPGNPPLYFILFKIWRMFFANELFFRFLSVILGLLFCFVFFIYLKKNVSDKCATAGLFLVSINIILIYFSQEIRCYMLLMLLSVLCSVFLFDFKKKNRIFYFISTLAMLYTHYYGAFLFLYNFIFGIFYLSKKRIKSFLAVNFISFLFYIPLIIYKIQGLTSDFNSWLKPPLRGDFELVFKTLAGSGTVFILFIIGTALLYCFLRKRKNKIFLKYNIFAIVFVFFASIIFSYVVKPIFLYRYFYIVYPMYLSVVCLFIVQDFKTKYNFIISFLILFVFGLNSRLNKQNLFCNHNLYFEYIKHDIDISKNNIIYASDTVKGYKKFENILNNKNTKIIYLPVNKGIEDINPLEENNPPFAAYILNLYLKDEAINKADKIELFKTHLGIFLKGEYN